MFDVGARIKLEGCFRPRVFVSAGEVNLSVSGEVKNNTIRESGSATLHSSGNIIANGFDFTELQNMPSDDNGGASVKFSGLLTANGFDFRNLTASSVEDGGATLLSSGNLTANGFDFTDLQPSDIVQDGQVLVSFSGDISSNEL